MAESTGRQLDEDDTLDSVNEGQGEIFEAGYDASTETVDLTAVGMLSTDVKTAIDSAYAPHGGADAVLAQKIAAENMASLTPDQKKARILKICEELYGPFLMGSEHLDETLKYTKKNKLSGILGDSLAEGVPKTHEEMDGRQNLRSAMYRLQSVPERDRAKFLQEAIGSVDFGELAIEEAKVEPMKEKLKSYTNASAYFRKGEPAKLEGEFNSLKTIVEAEMGPRTVKIDKTKPLKVQMTEAKSAISNNRSFLNGNPRPSGPPKTDAEEKIADSEMIVAQIEKITKKGEFYKGLKALVDNFRVCKELGVPLSPNYKVSDISTLIEDFDTTVNEDFSFADVEALLLVSGSTPLLDALKDPKFKTASVADKIAKKSGSTRKEVGQQEEKVKKLQAREKKTIDISDEDLAIAINKQILKGNPVTSSLDNDQKEERAHAMLLRDLTVMNNADYADKIAGGINVRALTEAQINDQVLKFHYDVLAEGETTGGKRKTPLMKLTSADLDSADPKKLDRAVRAGKLDWQGAFVLFMSLEKLGEEHSARADKAEKIARTLLAKSLKTQPYSQKCETAFQDQVAMLKPHIDNYHDNFSTNRATRATHGDRLVDSAHKWLTEALRIEELEDEDFESTVSYLEEKGYFTAERTLDKNGTIGVLPKDRAIAALQAMFRKVPSRQRKKDRGRLFGKELFGLGKNATLGAVKGPVAGFGKFYCWTMPKAMLNYGLFRPVHLGASILTLGKLNAFAAIKGDIKRDASGVAAKTSEVLGRGKEGIKRGWGYGVDATKSSFRRRKNMGDEGYTARTKQNVSKLKSRFEAVGKNAGKPMLTLTEDPYIDLAKYKDND